MKEFLKVSVMFFFLAIFASRIRILIHEFIGHGFVALLCGGEIKAFKLFFFHGGWIRYSGVPTEMRWISLHGGCALTIFIGALLWGSCRFISSFRLRLAIFSTAACCLIYDIIYFSRSLHYGFGDGMYLHRVLEGQRYLLSYSLLLVFAILLVFLTRDFFFMVRRFYSGESKKIFVIFMAASVFVVALLHGGLRVIEVRMMDEAFYKWMRPVAVRRAENTVVVANQKRIKQGKAPMSDKEKKKLMTRVKKENRVPPFDVLVYAILGLATIGAYRIFRFEERGSKVEASWLGPEAFLGVGMLVFTASLRFLPWHAA